MKRLYSIAPDAPFLPLLADRVLDGTLLGDWPRQGPFWLVDVTIILPTRRAKLALAEIFTQRGHRFLPDIRTLGGDAAEEEPFLPPLDAPQSPLPMLPIERRLILSQLIAAWAQTAEGLAGFASPPHAAEMFYLADSLAGLIDDLTIEAVPAKKLRDIAPEALASNWQDALKFLDIVLKAWPKILSGRGQADAAALRNERLLKQAKAAPFTFGDRPVIAAGSTGSIPATASLLAALAELPRGVIVLPGLDTTLSAQAHQKLTDETAAPHGHPQYGLAKLLTRLKSGPAAVVELAEAETPRRLLVRQALALADDTGRWSGARAVLGTKGIAAAIADIDILSAANIDEEARAIAVRARDALGRGKSVGIISPDRNLARRIAAELQRFNIDIDDDAGTPLFQSAAGRLLRLILAAFVNGFAPVALMALLHNRATLLGLPRAELVRRAQLIEMGLLRDQPPFTSIAGLHTAIVANVDGTLRFPRRRLTAEEGQHCDEVLRLLEEAMAPLAALLEADQLHAADLSDALMAALQLVTTGEGAETAARPRGSKELERWAAELAALGGQGLGFAPDNLDQVLSALMAGHVVPAPERRRDDIFIWGMLEARLMHPDVMILAGLNEEIWPAPADPGPWLSRGMRLAAGLEPPERQQGQMAHDFEMALGNSDVLIALAERLDGAPALPSRLVQRLEAFAGPDASAQMRARGAVWCEAARALDAIAGAPQNATRPEPRPIAATRPRQLSVIEIETLFRSPYDLYARHVLRLKPLTPLGQEPGGRERGSMIHDVFARFIESGYDPAMPNALGLLEQFAEQAFAGLDMIGDRRDIWLRRFRLTAEQFLDWERSRSAEVMTRHAEIAGTWSFPNLDGFTLSGRADRIDRFHDGRYEIIDFKTGTLPKPKDMQAFEAPQMLLEAAMAKAGAFKDLPPAAAAALTYIKIGLGPEAFVPSPFRPADGFDLMAAADEISRRMQSHVAALLISDTLPMAARIRPDLGRRYRGEYDHLARTDEWTLTEGSEAP